MAPLRWTDQRLGPKSRTHCLRVGRTLPVPFHSLSSPLSRGRPEFLSFANSRPVSDELCIIRPFAAPGSSAHQVLGLKIGDQDTPLRSIFLAVAEIIARMSTMSIPKSSNKIASLSEMKMLISPHGVIGLRDYVSSKAEACEPFDVAVVSGDHANCDSLPLRYGIHFQSDAVITLKRVEISRKPQFKQDRVALDAYFNDSAGNEQFGHFIIGERSGFNKPVLVTVWSHDANTEEHLSDVMSSLRKRGVLSPAALKELHPKYLNGSLRTHDDLVLLLATRMSMEQVKQMKEVVANSVKLTNEVIAERDAALTQATQVTERLKIVTVEKDQALEEIRKKDQEIARLQRQSLMVPDRSVVVTPSNVATIVDVTESVQGRNNQRAIILHMSDGTSRANNWERDYDSRLKLALALKGRQVRTDVWNRPDTNYKWKNWFKNIYVV